MNKYAELPQTKKGKVGEEYVRHYLEGKGYIVYGALTDDKAHLFDFIAASKAKREIFITEVKSKSKRKVYDDTGIDHRHYLDYTSMQSKYNMDVFIMFVDEENGLVYGNFLSELEKPVVCNVTGSRSYEVQYPLVDNYSIHYWPLSRMVLIARIDDETVKLLQGFTTKQDCYKQSNCCGRTTAILGTQL